MPNVIEDNYELTREALEKVGRRVRIDEDAREYMIAAYETYAVEGGKIAILASTFDRRDGEIERTGFEVYVPLVASNDVKATIDAVLKLGGRQ